jgi:hypothetical protein
MPTPTPGTIDEGIDWVEPRLTTVAKGGAADLAGLLIIAVDSVSVAELGSGSIMQLITQRPAGAGSPLQTARYFRTLALVGHAETSNWLAVSNEKVRCDHAV